MLTEYIRPLRTQHAVGASDLFMANIGFDGALDWKGYEEPSATPPWLRTIEDGFVARIEI